MKKTKTLIPNRPFQFIFVEFKFQKALFSGDAYSRGGHLFNNFRYRVGAQPKLYGTIIRILRHGIARYKTNATG